MTGMIPVGTSGVRDYGDLLAEELCARGWPTSVLWVENPGDARGVARASGRFLTEAMRLSGRSRAIWNYTPVQSGYGGIPGPAALFAIAARLRGAGVVTVIHELAQPMGVGGRFERLRRALQLAALAMVLLGSREVFVTTEERAQVLSRFSRWLSFGLQVVPVFSNFSPPRPLPPRPPSGDALDLVVLDYAADFARPDVVLDAVARLRRAGAEVQVTLLGAPGPSSTGADRWRAAAVAHDAGTLHVSGVLGAPAFAQRLRRADVLVLPNAQGPSARKGTLAAALAHGCPVVSIDGPLRWAEVVAARALLVVPPDGAVLAAALDDLARDAASRLALGDRAAAFYDSTMSIERTADAVSGVLAAMGSRRPPARRRTEASLP